uniref:Endoplasmic reticulum vesicle transporter C-terminal domain-containing protein n=1 Tax=Proboscia inermis TaxID=420281 RepID=A0A7S0GAV9_9STRA|mmetsp:Transcript_19964/g.20279  ORF Transcript_19964/g.20279 Transcript_19964/m.20279 type:complete len:424 (+) Transcript_19964:71-1342(+)
MNGIGSSKSSGGGLADRLKRMDAHSSVSDDFLIRTAQGAILSVLTVLAITYFTYAEYIFNFAHTVKDTVHINATAPAGLQVEFDVTLPKIPCALLSIDAADPSGQPQSLHIDTHHRVWKHRLDENGRPKGKRSRFEFGNTMTKDVDHEKEVMDKYGHLVIEEEDVDAAREMRDSEVECGPCYGAGEDGECCNTCDDIKRAYRRAGWQVKDIEKMPVCYHQAASVDEENEGCNVHGIVALSTGGGNLHLAPNREMEKFGTHKQFSFIDMLLNTFESFNVSHTVNMLHFGEEIPGNSGSQLDGQVRNIKDAYGMYQYYITIVPTMYKFLDGRVTETNQFHVTEHMRHVNPGSGRGLPGVFFFYEFSPLHVVFEESRRGWTHFFTGVCAAVGGVFTVMGIFDRIIFGAGKGGGIGGQSSGGFGSLG